MTTVRELITKIGFDVDTKALDKANQSIEKIKSSIVEIGVVALGAGAALFGLVKSTASFSEDLLLSAKDIGISTKSLQEFSYAAQQSGVSADEFTLGLKRFERGVGQAAQTGVADDFINDLRRIGVSIQDATTGNLKPIDQLLTETADGLSKVKTAYEQNAISQQLFGHGGTRLAHFLAQGSEEINRLRERAQQLNIVLSDESLNANKKFEDSFRDLRLTIEGIKNQLGSRLIPAFDKLLGKIEDWILINSELIQQKLQTFIDATAHGLEILWGVLEIVGGAFSTLTKIVGGTENAFYLFIVAYSLIKLGGLMGALYDLTIALKAVVITLTAADVALLLIPMAIAALVAGISWLILKTLDWFNVTDDVLGKGGDAWINFAKIFATLGLIGFFTAIIVPIKSFSLALAGASKSVFAFAGSMVTALAPFVILGAGIGIIIYAVYKLSEILLSIDWHSILATIGRFFSDFASYVNEKFDEAIKYIKDKWQSLKDWFSDWINSLINKFSNLTWSGFIEGSKEVFKTVGHNLYEALKGAINDAADDLKDLLGFAPPIRKAGDSDERKKPGGILDYETRNEEEKIPILPGGILNYSGVPQENDKGFFANLLDYFKPKGNATQLMLPVVQQMQSTPFAKPSFQPNQLVKGGDSFNNQTKNNNVTMNANISVNVPPQMSGSLNSEQAIGQAVKKALDDHIDGMLEQGFYNNPVLE